MSSKAPKCAICGRPQQADVRPFCSRRCADVDLQRWLSNSYAIAGAAEDDHGGERPDDADSP